LKKHSQLMAVQTSAPWALPEKVREEVLGAVRPDSVEMERIGSVAVALVQKVDSILDSMGLEHVGTRMTGSVAKGTCGRSPDLDLFLLFPQGSDPDTVVRAGLEVGTRALDEPRKSYAQHPYMTGSFMGLPADIVPAIDIPIGSGIVTAVDRTPHHTDLMNAHLDDRLREEVLLLKSFLKGIGAYGAEDTSAGFSGYLAELMVLIFDGFAGAVEHFAGLPLLMPPDPLMEEAGVIHFAPGTIAPIDTSSLAIPGLSTGGIGDARDRFHDDPLVAIDPVDPVRNVGSPVSCNTLALVCRASRDLIDCPCKDPFHPFSRRPLEPAGVWRSRTDLALPLPAGNPSRIASQVRSAMVKLSRSMVRTGFDEAAIGWAFVFPRGRPIDPGYLKARNVWAADVPGPLVAVRVRTEPDALEDRFRHWGPPVDNPRSADFASRWRGSPVGEEGGRSFVMRKRTTTDPLRTAQELWSGLGLGPDLSGSELARVEGGKGIHEGPWQG